MNKAGQSASAIADDDDEPNIGGLHRTSVWQLRAVISAFMVLTLLEAACSTSTSTALVAFGVVIPNLSSAQTEWIGNSYMLAAAVVQLPIASMSGIFGRKPLVMMSFALFFAGAAIAGASHNVAMLLTGRTIQGIGGAGTLVLAEVCIADLVPLRNRAKYYALISIMWALGSGLGPLIGGGFTQNVTQSSDSWRWIFFINLPIIFVTAMVTAVVFKEPLSDGGRECLFRREQLKNFDWIGTFLVTSSATSFILGLTLGGVNFPWKTYNVLLPLILGLVGLVGYGVFEKWGTTRPMLSMDVLFANRSALISYSHALIQGFMMEALPYYLPLFFQGVLLYSPVISGVALLPYAFIVLPSSLIAGNVVSRFARYKWVSAFGWAVLTLGLGLLLIPSEKRTGVGYWLGPLIPTSIGLGTLYSVLGTAVQAPQKPENWADAAAMMSFVRSVGEAVGVAVGGAIFASQMVSRVANQPLPEAVSHESGFMIVEYIRGLADSDPTKLMLQADLTGAMHTVYYLYIGVSAFCLVTNLFIKDYSLDSKVLVVDNSSKLNSLRKGSDASSTDFEFAAPLRPSPVFSSACCA